MTETRAMDVVSPPLIAPLPKAVSADRPSSSEPARRSFKDLLTGLGERMDRGEASVQGALHVAPKLGPAGELLMLQAGVYQYTETFEVAAKMVDKATSAIKTTLQGQ